MNFRLPRRPLSPILVLTGVLVAGTATYEVQIGDTLSDIAHRHGTTVEALARANGITDPNRIIAGTSLRITGSAGVVAATGQHTVVAGETLSGIALRYGSSVADIASANGVTDVHHVRQGQVLAIPTASAPSSAPQPVGRAEVERLLTDTAQRYGWNPRFVKAVAWQESGWKQSVVSSVGAIGVMQVLPSTGQWVSTHVVGRPLDLHDPADNIEAGVAFLDYLHRVTGGDAQRILEGYYQGLRSVDANGAHESTGEYVANVLALRERFR